MRRYSFHGLHVYGRNVIIVQKSNATEVTAELFEIESRNVVYRGLQARQSVLTRPICCI